MKTHKCGNCGEVNSHYNRFCPHARGICHFCKKGIHKKEDCPYYLWHLFKEEYHEIKEPWKYIIELRCDPEKNFYLSNWPQLIYKKNYFNDFDNEIKKRKYKLINYNFILYTINLYDEILVTQNTNIDSWINILNRFHFIKTYIEI
jgi:hypothetical protein